MSKKRVVMLIGLVMAVIFTAAVFAVNSPEIAGGIIQDIAEERGENELLE